MVVWHYNCSLLSGKLHHYRNIVIVTRMIPLSLIYWYSIASMSITSFWLVFALSRVYGDPHLPFDAGTAIHCLTTSIHIGLNLACMRNYHRSTKTINLQRVFWLSTGHLIYSWGYFVVRRTIIGGRSSDPMNDDESWRSLGVPSWAYPIFVIGINLIGTSITFARILWLLTFMTHYKLFPKLWKFIGNKTLLEGIRGRWYLHLVTILPTLLFIYKEITIFSKHQRPLSSRDTAEEITFKALSLLLITSLSIAGCSNGLLYVGLWQSRPRLLRVFVLCKCVTMTPFLSLYGGINTNYRKGISTGMDTLNVTLVCLVAVCEFFFAYAYRLKLDQGWKEERETGKATWHLAMLSRKSITGIQNDPVGQGHTSTVYSCYLKEPKSIWFLKSKKPLPAALKHFLVQHTEEISHELNTLTRIAKIKHANVVRFYGICFGEHMVSAVFELCPAGNLQVFLVRLRNGNNRIGPVLLNQLVTWSAEIAVGMEYLSNNDIIHGDLAARNVLLSGNLTAKISDFGLSHKLYGNRVYELGLTTTSSALPWKWMAPEILTDWAAEKASDVWSYGITLWEIYSLGREPWPEYEWDSGFSRILHEGIRPSCPQHASQNFYEKCMLPTWELDTRNRPSFAQLRDLVQEENLTFNEEM